MDRIPAPVDPPIGPALRELLDASPKAVRRAVEDRGGGHDDFDTGGKRGRKDLTVRLVSSLDAVARFLSNMAVSDTAAESDTTHPVLDPLLERIVRPSSSQSGDKSSADRLQFAETKKTALQIAEMKKTALRIVTWLLSPSPSGAGGTASANVGGSLVQRLKPAYSKRVRLAACLALKHAAVNLVSEKKSTSARVPETIAASAVPFLLATVLEAEKERARDEPPTRLAVAAVDALLAATALGAAGASASAAAAREVCVIVRSWWRPTQSAPILALTEVIRAFDTVKRWTERCVLEKKFPKNDPDEVNRRNWLASAWRDWAPLIAVDGFLGFAHASCVENLNLPDGIEPASSSTRETHQANQPKSATRVTLGPNAARLGRWLATCAACAADDGAGVVGAGDRLKHALVCLSLCAAQLGLTDPRRGMGDDSGDDSVKANGGHKETRNPTPKASTDNHNPHQKVSQDTNDAFSLLKAHASEVLVPALRSRNLKNQDMGAALLRAVLVPSSQKRWGPEQTALLDGLLPLLEEAPELITPGLGSLCASLCAVEPNGKGLRFVATLCVSVSTSVRRNAAQTLGEAVAFLCDGGNRDGDTADHENETVQKIKETVRASARALVPRVSPLMERAESVRDAAVFALQRVDASIALEAIISLMDTGGGGDRGAQTACKESDTENEKNDDPENAARVVLNGVLVSAKKGKGAACAVRCLLQALGVEHVAKGRLSGTDLAVVGTGASRAIACFASWCETRSESEPFDDKEWTAAAYEICETCLRRDDVAEGTASATATTRLAGELSQWLGAPPVSRVVFERARLAMAFDANQVGLENLDENVDDESAKSNDVKIAFSRLKPLLLLRPMPIEAWDDWSAFESVADTVAGSAETLKPSEDLLPVSNLLPDILLRKALKQNGESDDSRRLAAELLGRVFPSARVISQRADSFERAVVDGRLGDARALALATLSGINARNAMALGGCDATTGSDDDDKSKDRLRAVLLLMATLPLNDETSATASAKRLETTKTKMGGLETVARIIGAELLGGKNATGATPRKRLGADGGGGGGGERVSVTLNGLVSGIVGDPNAPRWVYAARTSLRDAESFFFFLRKGTQPKGVNDDSPQPFSEHQRVALADVLISACRRPVGDGDPASVKAFADATYPKLLRHASGDTFGETDSVHARAGCFRVCMVAFARDATSATQEEGTRKHTQSVSGSTPDMKPGPGKAAITAQTKTQKAARAAATSYATALAVAASKALSDAAEHSSVRLAAAGVATALLAADDSVLRVLQEQGSLEMLQDALRAAAVATDEPGLVRTARGLLRAMGAVLGRE